MIQLFMPQVFSDIFPQYVHWFADNPRDVQRATEVHLLWRAATANIRPGFARFYLFKDGNETMAGFGNFTFSTLRIEAEDAPAFEKWLGENAVNPLAIMEQFSGDGFKISAAYVVDQNSFCVTIVGTRETKRHESLGMSSWSDDLGECLAMAWYKHYVICDGGDWPTRGKSNRWG